MLFAAVFSAPRAAAAAPVEIPFAFEHGKVYIDNVFIGGGGPYRAALDTGSTHIGIDAEAAEELALPEAGSMNMRATGGAAEVVNTQIPAMKINNIEIFPAGQRAMIASIRPAAAAMGERIDIILGYPLMRRYVVEIDYPAQMLRLRDPAEFVPPAGAGRFALNLLFNVPVTTITIDGHEARAMLDTGSNSALDTYPDFMESSGLAGARKLYDMPVIGLAGTVDTRLFRAAKVAVGSHEFTEVKVYAHNRPLMSGLDALLGSEIMRRFTVTLDYWNSVAYMVPSAAALASPWDDERAGFVALSGAGGCKVVAVVAESPAARAGLKIGDTITKINSKSMAETGISELRKLVRGAPGTKIALDISRDGAAVPAQIVIILEDYVQ